MGPRNLDIYIGYTEEILKTCARISSLSQLSQDSESLIHEIKSMYALDPAPRTED